MLTGSLALRYSGVAAVIVAGYWLAQAAVLARMFVRCGTAPKNLPAPRNRKPIQSRCDRRRTPNATLRTTAKPRASRELKKGTGSERTVSQAIGLTSRRGACPLFHGAGFHARNRREHLHTSAARNRWPTKSNTRNSARSATPMPSGPLAPPN